MPKGVYERKSLEARIRENITIDEEKGCWVWTAHIEKDGYGQVSDGYRTLHPHRCMYEIKYGPIAEGLVAGHLCDEKYPKDCKLYRKCCNPDHIKPMTNKENIQRSVELGRYVVTSGAFKEGHGAGENNIKAILSSATAIEMRKKQMDNGPKKHGDALKMQAILVPQYPQVSVNTIRALLSRKDYRKNDKPPGWDEWFASN